MGEVLVDCPRCKAKVNAEEVAEYIGKDEVIDFDNRYIFLKCVSCEKPIVTVQSRPDENEIWDSPRRIYPPMRRIGFRVPAPLRKSFQEAVGCQESAHYLATALMCRRIIEGVCIHYLGSISNLASGIQKLREKNIIDERLFDWASALRNDGNLAAHDLEAKISSEDAADLVDFTEAILDYVFVLHDRFMEYKKRRDKVKRQERQKGKKRLKKGVE